MADTTKVAFSHDGTTELNPKTSKPGWLGKVTDSGPKMIALSIAILGLFLLWTLNRSSLTEKIRSIGQTRSTGMPSEGPLHLDTTWRNGLIVDSAHDIDVKLLTDGVWWQERLDRDDSKVYDLYPRNWSGGRTNIVTSPANFVEYRIKPGQEKAQGEAVYAIRLKSEPQRF